MLTRTRAHPCSFPVPAGLERLLRAHGVTDVYVVGIAADVGAGLAGCRRGCDLQAAAAGVGAAWLAGSSGGGATIALYSDVTWDTTYLRLGLCCSEVLLRDTQDGGGPARTTVNSSCSGYHHLAVKEAACVHCVPRSSPC